MLRNGARHGPCVAAWHDVIPNRAHRDALEVDAESIVGATFWIEPTDVPACSLERLALDVLKFHTTNGVSGDPSDVIGAEWWVQVRRSDGTPTIPLHWDSDEEHKATAGEHIPPWRATVTYLGSRGAPTVVLPLAADAHGRAIRTARSEAYISQPVAGKHLCFDGRLLHGALHELGASSSTAPEHAFVRTSILVNLWRGRQPDACRLPPTVAATLSNLDVCSGFRDAARAVKPTEPHAGCLGLMTRDHRGGHVAGLGPDDRRQQVRVLRAGHGLLEGLHRVLPSELDLRRGPTSHEQAHIPAQPASCAHATHRGPRCNLWARLGAAQCHLRRAAGLQVDHRHSAVPCAAAHLQPIQPVDEVVAVLRLLWLRAPSPPHATAAAPSCGAQLP